MVQMSHMWQPHWCVRCVHRWALVSSSCIMWPFVLHRRVGGRLGGREVLSCVFYCSIAETRHPSMARFSKGMPTDGHRFSVLKPPMLQLEYSFQETPLSLRLSPFQQRPFEPDKITYPRNWRRRNIHHLLLLLLLPLLCHPTTDFRLKGPIQCGC